MYLPYTPKVENAHEIFLSSHTPNDEMISEVFDRTVANMIRNMNITLSNEENISMWD